MGIEQLRQLLNKLGKLVVQPLANHPGEKRHAFEQAFDVRVDWPTSTPSSGRQGRVAAGKLIGQTPQLVEFT